MSNVDQIAALEIGEVFTKSQRLADSATLKDMKKAGEKMSNTLRSAAARATKLTGLQYHVERGDVITKNDDWIVCVFVSPYK